MRSDCLVVDRVPLLLVSPGRTVLPERQVREAGGLPGRASRQVSLTRPPTTRISSTGRIRGREGGPATKCKL